MKDPKPLQVKLSTLPQLPQHQHQLNLLLLQCQRLKPLNNLKLPRKSQEDASDDEKQSKKNKNNNNNNNNKKKYSGADDEDGPLPKRLFRPRFRAESSADSISTSATILTFAIALITLAFIWIY